MDLSFDQISGLPSDIVRAALPEWIAAHVTAEPAVLDTMKAELRARIAAAPEAEMDAMRQAFLHAGEDYRLYRASPFARDVTRIFMHHLPAPGEIVGREHLDRFLGEGPRRRLVICNHLSYTDTQLTDCLLVDHGLGAVADRLVAIAGPKVYTDPWRRMAAIALNTRKTAQSSAVATEQDTLSARELVVVARDTIADCERLMDEGWLILLYPEGTRSRSGRLQPFLRASARYTTMADVQILPMVQTGSDRVYPIGSEQMFRAPVRLAFGEPFVAAEHPGKTNALTEAWRRLAGLLPPAYGPSEETAPVS